MKPTSIGAFIDNQEWLRPVDQSLTRLANLTLKPAGRGVQNFLHGKWFGHPLHPALVSVPLGAWSVATVLDFYEVLTSDGKFAPGADAAVGIGLISSLGAAASGLNDWQHTDRPARRVGAVHGVLNLVAMALFFVSWRKRKEGSRNTAIRTGFAAWIFSMAAAWLGGHLAYREKIGVDHAQREGLVKFTAVLQETDLPENELRRVSADGLDILLVKRDGHIFAIGEKCSHLGGPLAEGKLDGDLVVCPWHGSRFSIADGAVIDGPATFSQPCFEVRVRKGQIEISRTQSQT